MLKMEHRRMLLNYLMIVLVLMVSDNRFTDSQSTPTPSCGLKLQPCLPYLNSTQPPSNCCTPLKEAVQDDLPCLCNLYKLPGLLTGLGLNITSANDLSRRCGINSSVSDCKNALATPPSKTHTPTPTPTPGSPGSSRVDYAGVVSSALMCWASVMMMLY